MKIQNIAVIILLVVLAGLAVLLDFDRYVNFFIPAVLSMIVVVWFAKECRVVFADIWSFVKKHFLSLSTWAKGALFAIIVCVFLWIFKLYIDADMASAFIGVLTVVATLVVGYMAYRMSGAMHRAQREATKNQVHMLMYEKKVRLVEELRQVDTMINYTNMDLNVVPIRVQHLLAEVNMICAQVEKIVNQSQEMSSCFESYIAMCYEYRHYTQIQTFKGFVDLLNDVEIINDRFDLASSAENEASPQEKFLLGIYDNQYDIKSLLNLRDCGKLNVLYQKAAEEINTRGNKSFVDVVSNHYAVMVGIINMMFDIMSYASDELQKLRDTLV